MIIGIEGSYRTDFGWVFPTHKNFRLVTFNEAKRLDLNTVEAFIQTNVLGVLKNKFKDQHDFITSTGKPRIVVEQATFRKNLDFDKPETNYYKMGLNHFTYNEGTFYNEDSPADRWDKIKKDLDITIKPWKNNDYDKSQYILFLLQNPIDTSLNDLIKQGSYEDWIVKTIKQIKNITGKKIRVRLHPRFQSKFNTEKLVEENVEISQNYVGWNKTNGGQSLYEDFKKAWCVVTYSSNGATEAICEGIPTINLHNSSFSWPVSYHTLDVLNNNNFNCNIDREQWLYDCAYTQWTLEEINSGIVHKRLLNGNRT